MRCPLDSTTVIGSFRRSMTRAPPRHWMLTHPPLPVEDLDFVELIPLSTVPLSSAAPRVQALGLANDRGRD